ncbi:MAG: hypothetical protein AAF560_26635, partial [Acidobacteriota bacterium]
MATGLLASSVAAQQQAGQSQRPLFRNPVEGTQHPVFETAGKEDAIDVFFTFGPPHQRQPSLGRRITEPQERWHRRILIDTGVRVPIKRHATGNTLNVVIHSIEDPMPAVQKLIQFYRQSPLPLSGVFLTRRTLENGSPGDAVPDPRMPESLVYEDPEEFWAALFDPELPPPVSEDPLGMLSVLTFGDGQVLNETRGMPMYLPGLRIAYGRPSVQAMPKDARNTRVVGMLQRQLLGTFPVSAAPEFFDYQRNILSVTKVRRGDRVGYSFAIERFTKKISPFVVRYGGTFRYREYELMRAIQRTIKRLDLEPVIVWHRGDVYAFSIWEKLDTEEDS